MGVRFCALMVLQALSDYRFFWYLFAFILTVDLILNVLIIQYVPYTEIDWIAYMQEVAGYLKENQLDYSMLQGQTGPLVYPAGFVWIFSVLFYATDEGTNIILAQYIFAALHTVFLAVLLILYKQFAPAIKMPPWVLLILFLSRRIHSIFVLRLFNDCWAMLFLYLSVIFFVKYRWIIASLLFSVALSIKMNILLFMPPLLVIMVKSKGWVASIGYLAIIGIFQILVGGPFLMHDAWAYLSCSFNFSRQFFYIWSVNWKMVPEEIFLSKEFANLLLAIHLGLLVYFGFRWCSYEGGVFSTLLGKHFTKTKFPYRLSAAHIMCLLFTGNFIGIACSRSLHYQFYVWYYHTLPALLWCTRFPTALRLIIIVLIELVWNIYPAKAWSSYLLLCCHITILFGLLTAKIPAPTVPKVKNK